MKNIAIVFIVFYFSTFSLAQADEIQLVLDYEFQTGRNLTSPFYSSDIEARPVVLSNGNLVVGGYDFHLYFIKDLLNGPNLFRPQRSSGSYTSQVVPRKEGDSFLVSNLDGHLYQYSNEGVLLKNVEVAPDMHAWKSQIYASPLELQNQMVVVGNYGGKLTFFNPELNRQKSIQLPGKIWRAAVELPGGMVMVNSFEEVSIGNGQGYHHFIKAPDMTDLNSRPEVVISHQTDCAIYSAPILWRAPNGQIRVITENASERELVVYDAFGKEKDRVSIKNNYYSAPLVLPNNGLVVAKLKGEVMFFNHDLSLMRKINFPAHRFVSDPIMLGHNLIGISSYNGYFFVFDLAGNLISSSFTGLASEAQPSFIAATKQVVIPSKNGKINFYSFRHRKRDPKIFFGSLLSELQEPISPDFTATFPINFIQSALRQLGDVRFYHEFFGQETSDFSEYYFRYRVSSEDILVDNPAVNLDLLNFVAPKSDVLILSDFLKNNVGGVLPLSEINININGIYHELFHVYFYHQHKKINSTFYQWFIKQAQELYPHLELERSEEALEEAFSMFIDSIISHFQFRRLHWKDIIEHPHAVKEMRSFALENDFYGYWTDGTGRSVYENIPLPLAEKKWVFEVLFEGKFGIL